MAKQTSILKFIGKIGRTVYYYHKHFGYLSRRVTSVDAERIRTDPAFARVRDNNTEFARGAWAVRLIRAAFLPLFKGLADTYMTSRLTSAVLAAIRSNTLQMSGQRRFEDANLEALQGFEFNLHSPLNKLQMPQYSTTVDYTNGTCALFIPQLITRTLRAPKNATHVRFGFSIASIDTATGQYRLNTVYAPEILLKEKISMPLTIAGELPDHNASHVFLTVGVEFLQAVNGDLYELKTRTHNTLTLVYAAATPIQLKVHVKRAKVKIKLKQRPSVHRTPTPVATRNTIIGNSSPGSPASTYRETSGHSKVPADG